MYGLLLASEQKLATIFIFHVNDDCFCKEVSVFWFTEGLTGQILINYSNSSFFAKILINSKKWLKEHCKSLKKSPKSLEQNHTQMKPLQIESAHLTNLSLFKPSHVVLMKLIRVKNTWSFKK